MAHRVLAAEDSATQGERLRSDLEAAGFEVVLARSGEEALERLDGDGAFDIVVSDVVMPGIDGYELCRRIKGREPLLPVVLLTSLSDPLDVVHGLEAGADNFLRKPYDKDQLIPRLRTMLYNRELRESGRAGSMGVELFFLNRRFMITAERQQILDLLMSTFEDLVGTNDQLRAREEDLERAHDAVATQLRAVEIERQRLRSVLDSVPEALTVIDRDGTVSGANGAWERLAGIPIEEVVGRPAAQIVSMVDHPHADPADGPLLAAVLEGGQPIEVGGAFDAFLHRRDGVRVPIVLRAAPIADATGAPAGAVSVISEIGGLAGHDRVTGLPTHQFFADRVARDVPLSLEDGWLFAVLVVSVHRFPQLRERIGSGRTDAVLAEVGERLRAALGTRQVTAACPSAFAAYLGGGELAVALPGLHTEVTALQVAEAICAGLGRVVSVEGVDVDLTIGVGIVFASDTDARAPELVPDAIAAAGRAIEGGRCYEVFDPTVHVRATERLRFEAELRRAIGTELVLHFQPVLRLGGDVAGAEALVRWNHPVRGLLPPSEFIPLAEETGLVVPLGWSVLREACRQLQSWRHSLDGAHALTVSVNLSTQQLDQPDAVDQVRAALEATGLDPACLVLEITESGVMSDAPAAVERLGALKALGVQLAVDDFGTGYSSLVYLRRFPVDALKVDRSFVAGMVEHAEDRAIVAGTIDLAHALGLQVVAEGVETKEQLRQIRRLGCDFGQGYHWSRPLPPEEFARWWGSRGPSLRRHVFALPGR